MNNNAEWEPYELKENVTQKEYSEVNCEDAHRMTDYEAKDLLNDWFGFERDRIEIIRSTKRYKKQVNSNRLAVDGENQRDPLYNATDWNYIRFNCGLMQYELYNGELQFFYD